MIKKGQLLLLLILTFVVVVAWVSFSIYHTYVTSTITPDLQLIITPINPDFDTKVLEKLKTRESVEPLFQMNRSLSASPSAEPTPTSTALPNLSPSPSTTPEFEIVGE